MERRSTNSNQLGMSSLGPSAARQYYWIESTEMVWCAGTIEKFSAH